MARTAQLLRENGFPSDLLVVADKNTLGAADGILDVLSEGGFTHELKLYDNLRVADITDVNAVARLAAGHRGILSVGTGSLNDICRLAARMTDREFAIFATAPSMDGFASGTSPITENNFKTTREARQPSVIIADTRILAASPAELKSAGFGDMIAKAVALVDWNVSRLVTGEYYCDNIAAITREALRRVVSMADRTTREDEETAGAIMEALVLTGLAMRLGDSVRPASGAEHIISHFWEIQKLAQGQLSDYHGKKVGVATLSITRLYKWLAEAGEIGFHAPRIDWDAVYAAYGPHFSHEVRQANTPSPLAQIAPGTLEEKWPRIRRLISEGLPSCGELTELMKKAGAATTVEEIGVSRELGLAGLIYHPFMRSRVNLSTLLPMMDVRPDYESILDGRPV